MPIDWRKRHGLPYPEVIYIYALIDPETQEPRYIGKTNDPKKRLDLHLTHARKNGHTPTEQWINSLLKRKLRPSILILEETTLDKYQSCERLWIASAKQQGWNLTNVSPGGGGP